MKHPYAHIAILGAGESGMGVAYLASQVGVAAFLSDSSSLSAQDKALLEHWGVAFEEGGHSFERLLQADAVVKSPGIPHDSAIVKELQAKGMRIHGELDWAAKYTSATLVGVTGSNGKTTTATWMHHIISAERDCVLAGNIGISLARSLATRMENGQPDPEVVVLEISSFQLDDAYDLSLDIGILTNITPDHLDRYQYSIERYAQSKMQMLSCTKVTGAFVFCDDDPISNTKVENWACTRSSSPRIYSYGFVGNDAPYRITAKLENKYTILINNEAMTFEELALQGKHNEHNGMAAGIAGRLLNIRKQTIREKLASFDHLEHRLETVLNISGVEYINDSKATNVNATYYALESQKKPVIWIVGGVDKGNDYNELKALVNQKVKGIVALGTDNTKILEFFGQSFDVQEANSMTEAVRKASKLAKKDDVVLLSPACASFDLFQSYEDRGQQFKDAVRDL